MVESNKRKKFVISVGGSLIVPNNEINFRFLTKLNTFIRNQLAEFPTRQFFLVVGGGASARDYRDTGKNVIGHDLSMDDLDWLGIHATRLNAHLVKTIFRDIAHHEIINDYTIIRKAQESVVVAGGWKPGWSTDYCATLLCEDYHISTIVNLSNIPQVYDKDPNEFNDAKPIDKLSWKAFRHIVGDEWVPGMHAPFDPIAAKKAEELKIRVVVMADDFKNIERYFKGEKYLGTVIE